MTEPVLLSQWAVCGIAAAAARFVPVPLLDDIVRERAGQVAVVRTLRAHGLRYVSTPLEPLWGDPGGRGSKRFRRLRTVPRQVLLFPVRKYTAMFGAVRGVPTDLLRVVLLARSLERQIERGGFRGPEGLTEQARALRRAVDGAAEGVDLRVLTAALADVLPQTRGLGKAAASYARRRFASHDVEADLQPDPTVAAGAECVTEVLRRPEVVRRLAEFDAEVDARLAAPAGQGRGRSRA